MVLAMVVVQVLPEEENGVALEVTGGLERIRVTDHCTMTHTFTFRFGYRMCFSSLTVLGRRCTSWHPNA